MKKNRINPLKKIIMKNEKIKNIIYNTPINYLTLPFVVIPLLILYFCPIIAHNVIGDNYSQKINYLIIGVALFVLSFACIIQIIRGEIIVPSGKVVKSKLVKIIGGIALIFTIIVIITAVWNIFE